MFPVRPVIGLGLAGLFVAISWVGIEVMVEQTGGEAFCARCHTMKPMAVAYREDVHGGRNR